MKTTARPRTKRSTTLDPRARSTEETSHRPFAALRTRTKLPKEAPPPAKPPPAPEPAEPSFAAQMKDVRPLAGAARRAPRAAAATAADEGVPAGAVETRFEVIDDGTALEGRRLDVDPRELGRLRRGQYPVDGTLDLHGRTLLDAKAAVVEFLARRRRQGDRAVVIVHGKGLHSSRGQAVLRGELGAWLSQGTAGKHVLAFASRFDGGQERSGAVLVLLALR